MKVIKYFVAILFSVAVAACGGGGGGGGSPGAGVVISGTAAAGAPIVGTVQARDSKGTLFGPVTIGADGKYSLTVTGGVAPFIMQANGTVGTATVAVYSVSNDPSAPNLNINPLTNMVVAEATGLDPALVFNQCTSTACATPNQARVDLGRQQVQVLLGDLLTAFGVTGPVNLLTDSIVAGPVAGQSPIDKMLDAVAITPDPVAPTSFVITPSALSGVTTTTVLVTVPAPPTGGVTTVATAPLAVDPATTTVATTATTALTALQGIQSQFTVLQGLFATAVPSANDTTLTALFDTSFITWGQNSGAFLSMVTGANGASAGATFTNVVAAAPRPAPATQVANDATHQWFTYVYTAPGKPAELNGPWLAVFDSVSQKWLFAGNQMPTPTFVGTYTSSTPMPDPYGNIYTHVENNSVSGGLVNINHTYTSTTTGITGQFIGTGLTLTIDPANNRHATFTGSGTLDNYVTGGTSNLRSTTFSGNLWVQNDGSINMYWSAPDPLGGTVGGCASTLGMSCPAPTSTAAGIVGTWAMSGATNFASAVLLADGRFMIMEDNGAGNCQDMEAGTYTYNAATSQLALTVMYDTSTTCGALQGASPTVAAPVTTTVTFNTSTGVLSSPTIPATTFTKLATGTTSVGTWLGTPNPGTDFAVLVDYADGRFMYAESPSPAYPSTGGRGLETGTYTATTSSYTFATLAFDGNGSTSGINAAVGLAMPMTVTDVNHIAVTTPGGTSLGLVRQ